MVQSRPSEAADRLYGCSTISDSTGRHANWPLLHRNCDDDANFLGRLDKMLVRKVGVTRRSPVPPVPEQLAHQRQVLARHDGLTGGGMAEVMHA